MKQKINPQTLAELEIKWLDAYHRRDTEELEQAIKELRKEQYGVEISDIAAKHFCSATKIYLAYRRALAVGAEDSAASLLKETEAHMQEHYEDIKSKLEK